MKPIIERSKTIIATAKNTPALFELSGELVMLILLDYTNFKEIKNPLVRYKKFISLIWQSKPTSKIERYCRLCGLIQTKDYK